MVVRSMVINLCRHTYLALFGLLLVAGCWTHAAEVSSGTGNVRRADAYANTSMGITPVDITASEEQSAVADYDRQPDDGSAGSVTLLSPTAAETTDQGMAMLSSPPDRQAAETPQVVIARRKEASEHYGRGIDLAIAGRYADSRERFTKALKLNPFNHGAASGLGMIDDAVSGRVRREVAAHMFRGVGYARDGRLDRAIAAWKTAADLDPGYAPAQTNLGTTYLGKGMIVEAAQCLRKALEIDPNDGAAHNNMGLYWVNQGEWDKALAEFERAVALKPTPGIVCMALNNAGLTYEERGLPDAALAMFQNVLAVNPNDSEAHYNLACHYYHKGEFELAISHCDKAERLGRKPHPNLVERLRPYR